MYGLNSTPNDRSTTKSKEAEAAEREARRKAILEMILRSEARRRAKPR